MPTYQYACTDCREQHEAVQSFTDDDLTTCPSCQGRLRKVFSAVGVVFKGSGFYRTDSRSAARSTSGATTGGTPATAKEAKDAGASAAATKTPATSGATAP